MTVLRKGAKGNDVARLQTLLNSNLKPIPTLQVDGDFGPGTEQAVLQFQRSRQLNADGVVGPQTWQALEQNSYTVAPTQPRVSPSGPNPWMTIAIAELGVHENAAAGAHSKRILEYHQATSLKATTDETPWCSSFVNWVMKQAGHAGTNNALAKSWLSWGKALAAPQYGAITVIQKKVAGADAATGSATGFHVAFFDSITSSSIRLLGGNQSDQVKYSNFKLASYTVKGYRWP